MTELTTAAGRALKGLLDWIDPYVDTYHSSCALDKGYDYAECSCGLDDVLRIAREALATLPPSAPPEDFGDLWANVGGKTPGTRKAIPGLPPDLSTGETLTPWECDQKVAAALAALPPSAPPALDVLLAAERLALRRAAHHVVKAINDAPGPLHDERAHERVLAKMVERHEVEYEALAALQRPEERSDG